VSAHASPPPNSLCQIPAGPLGSPHPASSFELVSGVWAETHMDLVCASTNQPSRAGLMLQGPEIQDEYPYVTLR